MKINKKSIILVFLLLAVLVYNFFEYRTKNLTEEFFNTEHLSDDIRSFTIADRNDITTMTIIEKSNPLYKELFVSLESLKIKQLRSSIQFYDSEDEYLIMFIYNNEPIHIAINDNGNLQSDGKYYEIKNEDAYKELLTIMLKGIQPK